jgi:ribose transport system ATP-binding protein
MVESTPLTESPVRKVGAATDGGVVTDLKSTPSIAVTGLVKKFGGAHALVGVDLDLRAGEVHCLIGENGAGKSTLVKILAGAVRPDAGQIELAGKPVSFLSPHDALRHGLAFIFQELGSVPAMTVAQNICLGNEPRRHARLLNRKRAIDESAAALARIGFERINPNSLMGSLSVGEQQGVMIARALWLDAGILVMDEPTAALGRHEVERLFRLIRQLASSGRSVLFISHKLEEIREIGDRVTVLRNGSKVIELPAKEASDAKLLGAMTGRTDESADELVGQSVASSQTLSTSAPVILEARQIRTSKVTGIGLSVHAGEILGIGGLVGSGRTEVLRALIGMDKLLEGSVLVEGREVHFHGPRDALRAGVVLVPEDRRGSGLLPNRTLGKNLLLGYEQLKRAERPRGAAQSLASEQVASLHIRPPNLDRAVMELSGGNQQKAIVGRWLLCRPKVLLLDEPTRGVDVGARAEIYRVLGRLAADGMAILMVTSDLRELVQVSDRILVMRAGRIVGELGRNPAESEVLALAFAEEVMERSQAQL